MQEFILILTLCFVGVMLILLGILAYKYSVKN